MNELTFSVGILNAKDSSDGMPRVGLRIAQGDFTLSTYFDNCADAILIGHKLVEAGREVKALMDPDTTHHTPETPPWEDN